MKSFSEETLVYFFKEIYLITRSNITLETGIEILYENEKNKDLKNIFLNIFETLSLGMPMSDALAREGFPEYCIYMVRLGEKTGKTEEICLSIYKHYENQAEFKKALKNIILMPSILLLATMTLLFILSVKIVPIFETVFNQMGIPISGLAKIFLEFSKYRNFVFVIFFTLILSIGLIYLNKDKLFKMSGINSPSAKQGIANFLFSLSVHIENGFGYEDAMSLCEKSDIETVNNKIQEIKDVYKLTKSLEETLCVAEVISHKEKSLLKLAVQTGNLSEVLGEIAENKQKESLDNINKALALFEPGVILVISFMMGLVLLNIMMPLLGVLSSW